MLLKISEIKEMSNERIVANIFFYGITMSGDKGSNQDEESLKRLFKELGNRGVFSDWEQAYGLTKH